MRKYITRSIEPIVKKIANQFPVIALTGPRQSGKSTMLRHLFTNYEFITFDNLETRMRAKKDPALFIESIKTPVIIDEIQYVPEILSYIKINVDQYTTTMRHDEINGKFILIGSQIFTLMAGLTETLAGRIALFELLPFSFEELGNKPRDLLDCYTQLLKGFYPSINTLETDSENFYGSYLSTYVERDVRQIQNIKDISQFQSFLKLLAGRAGNLLNLQEIAKEIGAAHATIKSWLGVLETSRIIYILRPYFRNISKRIVKTPKIYFTDTGLLGHLLGYQTPETLLSGPASGAIFENMLVIEALKSKINYKGREELYFYRDSNGVEVDLVIEENINDFTLIEIKSSKVLQYGSAKQLMKIPLQSNKRMILSLIDKKLPLNKDVMQLPWWEYVR